MTNQGVPPGTDPHREHAEATYAIDRNWRIISVSEGALRAWGMSRERLLGNSLYEVFPAAVGTDLHQAQARAMAQREPVRITVVSTVTHRPVDTRIEPTPEGGLVISFREAEAGTL